MHLTLRHTWPPEHRRKSDYQIVLDGKPIGRTYEYTYPPQQGLWFWGVGTHVQEAWMRGVHSRDEARARVRSAIERARAEGIRL